MNHILFEGVYSATFAFYDTNLNVIKDSVKKLIDYNVKNGIKGFYVGGNTGECTVLPNHTRKQMLEAVKEFAPADTQIIAHVGAGHLCDVEDLVKHANCIGVDAISSLPPSLTAYYQDREIIDYYRYLADISKSPVLAYVTPVLTSEVVQFAKQIMTHENIIGLKYTLQNYYAFEQLKTINNGNINLLNGPDTSMLAGLSMGGDGAIGTNYNLMPKTACAIYDNFQKGDMKEALRHQRQLNRFIDTLIASGENMAIWKSVMTILDIDPGHSVAPMHIPTQETVDRVIKQLEENGSAKIMRESL